MSVRSKKARKDGRQNAPELTFAMILSFICLVVAFTLFHEVGRLFSRGLPLGEPYGSFFSCMTHPLGALIGAALAYTPFVSKRAQAHPAKLTLMAFCALAVCCLAYYFTLAELQSLVGICAIGTFAGATFALVFIIMLSQIRDAEIDRTAYLIAGCIVACALCGYVVLQWIAASLPLWAACAFHIVFIGAAAVLWLKCDPSISSVPPASPPSDTEERFPVTKAPLLIAHHLTYGFALGLLHIAIGIFGLIGPDRNALQLIGALAGALITIATYTVQRPTAREPWTNLRRIVFPLLSSFTIVPMFLHSAVATPLVEMASVYYGALFVLCCLFAMKESRIAPFPFIARGMLFLCLGLVLGVLVGILPLLLNIVQQESLVAAIMVSLGALTFGTFWIGDPRALRTWWGLRRSYTAKKFSDNLVQKKCAALAEKNGLSARELEVFVLLAQGHRASQIKDELFISLYTVRAHIHNIYVKLDVHSSKQLIELVSKFVV